MFFLLLMYFYLTLFSILKLDWCSVYMNNLSYSYICLFIVHLSSKCKLLEIRDLSVLFTSSLQPFKYCMVQSRCLLKFEEQASTWEDIKTRQVKGMRPQI